MAERLQLPPYWPWRQHSRQVVTADGLRWHLQHWPAPAAGAPLALLLHGTGASAHSWRTLAPLLATRFELLVPDLPGHAYTDTPPAQPLDLPAVAAALDALLRQLGARPALLVGHSAGAAVALQMVLSGAAAPRLVVSINGALLPLGGVAGRLLLPLARALAGNPLVVPAFAAWAAWPPVTRRLLDGTGSRIDAVGERCYTQLVSDPRHAAGALRLMASWDLQALASRLPALRVPLQLQVGLNDRTLPPSHADRVRALVPQAQRVDLPGLGHLAHEEDAAAVAAAIDAAWLPAAARSRIAA